MQSDAGIDVARHPGAQETSLNQGAMFFGLRRLDVGPDHILITFDCDGEDDVAAIPSILELSALNPGKMVLIKRRASEGIDAVQSVLRLVQTPIPLLRSPDDCSEQLSPDAGCPGPGRSKSSPLAAVHFAYAILKLRPRYVATTRDRRARYGGSSSQNVFMLVSHGLVGLMLFYEVVVAKIFMLLFLFGGFGASIVGLAALLPADCAAAQRALIWSAIVAGLTVVGLFSLLLSAALVLIFKLAAFTLVRSVAEPPGAATPQSSSGAGGSKPALETKESVKEPVEGCGRNSQVVVRRVIAPPGHPHHGSNGKNRREEDTVEISHVL